MKERITLTELKELLDYNPQSGWFFWKKTKGGAHAGHPVGEIFQGPKSKTAYIRLMIKGVRYWAHDLVWFWFNGTWPIQKLDHKDGNGLHNFIDNLREANAFQNKANSPIYSNNTSGYPGVNYEGNKWRAVIKFKGEKTHIGVFDTFEDAVNARKVFEQKLFGEFAREHY